MDLNDYMNFVDEKTSDASKNVESLKKRLDTLEKDVKISRLLTASIGLAGEGGEFDDIVKKVVFQEKPFTLDLKAHLVKELGDVFWYWTQACLALDVQPCDVIDKNVEKLSSRFSNGMFKMEQSENRKDGDI